MDPDPRFDLLFILKIEKKKIPNDVNFVSGVNLILKNKKVGSGSIKVSPSPPLFVPTNTK